MDIPILGPDFLLDHGMVIDMAERKLDWIGGTLHLREVTEQVYYVEDFTSVGMERQIAMACIHYSEGHEVQGFVFCMLEPDQELMDRTGVRRNESWTG